MIMVLILGLIAAVCSAVHVVLIYMYYKSNYKPHLYLGVTCFFLALAAVFGVLIGAATFISNLSLIKLFGRISTTSGVSAFVFANIFAIAMTKPDEKMRGIWISFIPFLILTFIVWACDFVVKGDIGGIPVYAFASMYKAPYGLPLVEIMLASMAVMAIYPTYLFFRVAKNTRDSLIKIQSLLMGIGIIIATTFYAIEMNGAVPYQYMPICIPMIMVGISMMFFGYVIPGQIEKILVGYAPASEERVKSFVKESFVYPVEPTVRTQPNVFSKALGLDHQQMAGRKILFEFDPTSNYETAVQDLAAEALANAEPIVIFTRRGSAIHSSMKRQKVAKFFCLTQQVLVPKWFSENEMLLPVKDASLILDVFDKTLKAYPEGNINVVFDNLSDLVFSIGFEKTHRFMRYTIEMLSSPKTTVMFLLNQTAHNPKVAHSLRVLFSDQISFGKDGIQSVKLSARTVLHDVG